MKQILFIVLCLLLVSTFAFKKGSNKAPEFKLDSVL